MKLLNYLLVLACVLLLSCGNNKSHKHTSTFDEDVDCCEIPIEATIYLVPMDDIKDSEVQKLQKTLTERLISFQNEKTGIEDWPYDYQIDVLPHEKSPDSCLNDKRSRFRASKLIRFLKDKHADKLEPGCYIIGITNKDISTSIHNSDDYGILGLSFIPGNTSVISTYRLKNKKDLWKLALHEYCHGFFSMKHCKNKDPKCIMNDAGGGNPRFDLKETFCETCMSKFSNYSD